jgi:hypothetical protein
MKNEMTDFHITVEDYLHAVCMLITELVSWCFHSSQQDKHLMLSLD